MIDYSLSDRPEYIEQLRAEVRGIAYRPAKRRTNNAVTPLDPNEARYLFTAYTGNRWMEVGAREPAAKMLFGKLWYEHELCFLFANSNTGKSVLAVQIGDAIARGAQAGPFACEVQGAKVLYADFELSSLQFRQRYSDGDNEYAFNDNFIRAQFNPATDTSNIRGIDQYSTDDWLIAGLEYRIRQLKTKVLIIDNISCLGGGTSNAAAALKIINKLNALRAQYKLSILVLAHTPKRNNKPMPVTIDDLHGSKLLINFADSAFTIGVSNTDNGQRYIKQIKQRSTEPVYGEDNVALCRLEKPSDCLRFRFEGTSTERLQLLNVIDARRQQLALQINQLSVAGNTQRQIAQQLDIAVSTVNKLLNR